MGPNYHGVKGDLTIFDGPKQVAKWVDWTVASPKRRRWALRFMNKMHHLNGGDGSHLQWSNIPVGESQRQCKYEQINTHKDAHACTPLTPCRGRLPKFHRPLCSSLGQASSSPQKKVVKAWHKAITSYQICISPPLLSNESSSISSQQR